MSDELFIDEEGMASFLRAGGALTLQDWFRLDEDARDAFERAGDAVWAERAAAIGMASQGPREAARVLGPADDGKAWRDLALRKALESAARKWGAA